MWTIHAKTFRITVVYMVGGCNVVTVMALLILTPLLFQAFIWTDRRSNFEIHFQDRPVSFKRPQYVLSYHLI